MKLNFENRNRVTQAIAFTTHIHGASGDPAVMLSALSHCLETAEITRTLTSDEDTCVAAVLHDIPERFPERVSLIRQCFGEHVERICTLESYPDYMECHDDNWQRRKLYTINHLAEKEKALRRIFLADKLSEVRFLCLNGIDTIQARKNPSLLVWYYRSVQVALSDFASTDAYRELTARVRALTEMTENR